MSAGMRLEREGEWMREQDVVRICCTLEMKGCLLVGKCGERDEGGVRYCYEI